MYLGCPYDSDQFIQIASHFQHIFAAYFQNYANSESQRLKFDHALLDQSWLILQSLLVGTPYGDDSGKYEKFIHQLACMFRRQPKVLQDVMKYNEEHIPEFRTSVLSSMFDMSSLLKVADLMNIQMRYHFGISMKRWQHQLAPLWQVR